MSKSFESMWLIHNKCYRPKSAADALGDNINLHDFFPPRRRGYKDTQGIVKLKQLIPKVAASTNLSIQSSTHAASLISKVRITSLVLIIYMFTIYYFIFNIYCCAYSCRISLPRQPMELWAQ